jgi:hypothetical protein
MSASENANPFEERHYTISELAEIWKFSREFVRQIVRGEPGVTEWVRQQPGRRRYSVIRVPQSVAERLYRRALTRADQGEPTGPRSYGRRLRATTRSTSAKARNDVFRSEPKKKPEALADVGDDF